MNPTSYLKNKCLNFSETKKFSTEIFLTLREPPAPAFNRVIKNFQKFHKNTCAGVSLLQKAFNFTKKRFCQRYLPANFAKYLGAPLLYKEARNTVQASIKDKKKENFCKKSYLKM